MRVIALYSDFSSFAARVGERKDGKEILALGGEDDQESFGSLMKKLRDLRVDATATKVGILVFLLGGAGLFLDIRRSRNVEPRDRG
jgi:hypothetical protein